MKALHVTQGYWPAIGGTEWLIQRLSEELTHRFGDEVTVFTTNCYNAEGFFTPGLPRLPAGWQEQNGVRIRRFPVLARLSRALRLPQAVAYRLGLPFNDRLRALSGGPLIPGLAAAIQDADADVVAASSFPLLHMFAALKGAHAAGRPCVLHGGLHVEDHWASARPMIHRAIHEADFYIANTELEARYVIEHGASPERVAVVGVGVDPEPFQQVSPQEAKRRLGLEGKPVVGFIGQLGGHKGVDTLLRAMPLVWQAIPEARLLIAGGRTLFVRHLEEIIRRWPPGYRRNLILKYDFPLAEKPWLFGAVDVFTYPSGFESFGIAFLEAWAAGKPVIGCRRGAIPYVVSAGRDGLLVDYQDEEALADAILLLLANPRWSRVLGEAGRDKMLTRYTWPEVARRFRDIYVDVLAKRHAPAEGRAGAAAT